MSLKARVWVRYISLYFGITKNFIHILKKSHGDRSVSGSSGGFFGISYSIIVILSHCSSWIFTLMFILKMTMPMGLYILRLLARPCRVLLQWLHVPPDGDNAVRPRRDPQMPRRHPRVDEWIVQLRDAGRARRCRSTCCRERAEPELVACVEKIFTLLLVPG
jgi:hypothetical protein